LLALQGNARDDDALGLKFMAEEKNSKKIDTDVLKWIIFGLAGFALIVLIFGAGMFVGGMKAKFSYKWAESYHKNFAGPKTGFLGNWQKMQSMPGDFIEGHGVFGEIIEIQDTGFIVKGRGDIEKIVIISDETIINKGPEKITNEIKIGDRVTIIGTPNEQGQIEAKLIRIFDAEKGLIMAPRIFRKSSPMPL
jgi:hypothetical protein